MPNPSARDARGPVTKELRRIYFGAIQVFGAASLFAISLALLVYMISVPPSSYTTVGFWAWWLEQRYSWQTSDTVAVSFAVIVPSVLSVILSANVPNIARSPRREAIVEAARNVLYWGLILSAILALLATANAIANRDVAGCVLALGVAAACSVLSQPMPPQGTERDLLLESAREREAITYWAIAIVRSKEQRKNRGLVNYFERYPSLTFVILTAVAAALPGTVPAAGLWVLNARLGAEFDIMAFIALALLFGPEGLVAFYAWSYSIVQRELGDRRTALLWLLVPALVCSVFVLALFAAAPWNRWFYYQLAVSTFVAAVIGVVLARSSIGAIFQLHELRGVSHQVENRIDFLAG